MNRAAFNKEVKERRKNIFNLAKEFDQRIVEFVNDKHQKFVQKV